MAYDPTGVTIAELLEMRHLLSRYVDKGITLGSRIVEDRRRRNEGQRTTGSQIHLLTVAHGCPSTHTQARCNSRRLASALAGHGMLIQTDVPRVHFTRLLGFPANYHPSRFGDRTGLGSAWTWVCTSHGLRHQRCSEQCAQGVQLKGRFLIDIVRDLV